VKYVSIDGLVGQPINNLIKDKKEDYKFQKINTKNKNTEKEGEKGKKL
jgi:hypothetical protein